MNKIEDSTKRVQEYIDKVTENGWYKPKGCEFCNMRMDITRNNIGMEIFEAKGRKRITLIVYEDGYNEEECKYEESFEVNYCPMCGKKLA